MTDQWHISTHSPNGSSCVAARAVTGGAEVRDSQNPERATLSLPGGEWAALISVASR